MSDMSDMSELGALRDAQRQRAALKRAHVDDLAGGVATELAIGAHEGSDQARKEREQAQAERQQKIEMWAREIDTIQREIESIKAVVQGESKVAEAQKKLEGVTGNETARSVYERALALRKTELETARQGLPAEISALKSAELAAILTEKQQDLDGAIAMRDSFLNA